MTGHILAVCLDSGDTLVDEGSEIREGSPIVLRASMIPGAVEMVAALKAQGYPLALVADGYTQSFINVLGPVGIYSQFDALAISEEVGVEKPDPRIFYHAMRQLDIPPNNYGRIVMVGNNLSRDILGANNLGIISVWLDWAPRRSKIPACPEEIPNYTIKNPLELLPLLETIERGFSAG